MVVVYSVDLYNQGDQCVISVNATWGTDEILKGQVETQLESLQESDSSSLENINDSLSRIPFKMTVKGNFNSTMEGLETVQLTLYHFQYTKINSKTDMDIQVQNFYLSSASS